MTSKLAKFSKLILYSRLHCYVIRKSSEIPTIINESLEFKILILYYYKASFNFRVYATILGSPKNIL